MVPGGAVPAPKSSSLPNRSWKDLHPICTCGCCRGCVPRAPRAPGSPQPCASPGLSPARSHGTAWHRLIIKSKSFAGRETQARLEFPPRSGCSEGQSMMLVPQQLPVPLN